MTARAGWYPPTQDQLRWAVELGVEVPEGISSKALSGLLRTIKKRREHAELKAMNLQPGMRFRRPQDGVTYTITGKFFIGARKLRAYNEKSKTTVEISVSSFLKFYELIQ